MSDKKNLVNGSARDLTLTHEQTTKVYPNSFKNDNDSMNSSVQKKLKIQKNYLTVDAEDLEKMKIKGCRFRMAMALRSKVYDWLMIILIILYTIFVLAQFGIDQEDWFKNIEKKIYITELVVLGVFIVEILLHLYAYGCLYIKDYWNIADIIVILLSLTFVLLDLTLKSDSTALKGILKIRGVFRLLRIFILARKLSIVKLKRDRIKLTNVSGYDLVSPLEKVVSILTELKNAIDQDQVKLIMDINYCLKMISSNKLYEAELEIDPQNGPNSQQKNDVVSLYNAYSAQAEKQSPGVRRQSKRHSGGGQIGVIKPSVFSDQAADMPIENLLKFENETKAMMEICHTADFDIFSVRKSTKENEMITAVTYILHKHKIFQSLKIKFETFMMFISKIQSGYKDITYHNKTHGADLSCTAYYYLQTGNFLELGKLDDIDFAAIIIGGACHDHEHFGFNNAYLIETRHEIAVKYNDVSVLENHHVASSFALIQQEKYNIFKDFDIKDYKKIRQKMIGCILATDMTKHFAEQSKFKSRITAQDFDPSGQDKDLCMFVLFHLADISNQTKKFELAQKWVDLLYQEFFMQGDSEREKEIPISYLMDRTVYNVASAQLGFIDVIIAPAFQNLARMLPNLNGLVEQIQINKDKWSNPSLVEQYQKKTDAEKLKLDLKVDSLPPIK